MGMIRLSLAWLFAVILAPAVALADGDVDADKVTQLIQQLGHDAYAKREQAQAKLFAMGPAVRADLVAALESDDAEIVGRAERLIESIDKHLEAQAYYARFSAQVGDNPAAMSTLKQMLAAAPDLFESAQVLLQSETAKVTDEDRKRIAGQLNMAIGRAQQMRSMFYRGIIGGGADKQSVQFENLMLAIYYVHGQATPKLSYSQYRSFDSLQRAMDQRVLKLKRDATDEMSKQKLAVRTWVIDQMWLGAQTRTSRAMAMKYFMQAKRQEPTMRLAERIADTVGQSVNSNDGGGTLSYHFASTPEFAAAHAYAVWGTKDDLKSIGKLLASTHTHRVRVTIKEQRTRIRMETVKAAQVAALALARRLDKKPEELGLKLASFKMPCMITGEQPVYTIEQAKLDELIKRHGERPKAAEKPPVRPGADPGGPIVHPEPVPLPIELPPQIGIGPR
jgi:hypothetical protein